MVIHDIRGWLRAAWQGSTLLSVILIVLVWVSLGFHQEVERNASERAAIQNSDNLARAFASHLSHSLGEIDRSLQDMRLRYMRHPEGFEYSDWLRANEPSDGRVIQLSIIGPDGFLKSTTMASRSGERIDLRDREHFRVHLDAGKDELFISKPVIGRATGKSTLQLTRRIRNSDGSFGGVLVASIDTNYFARLYGSVDIGLDGYINVVGTDGFIRAVDGRGSKRLGIDLSRTPLFEHYSKQPSGWFYNPSQLIDKIPRLVTYRAVENFPLIITIGFSKTAIFGGVEAKQRAYNIAAATLTMLILMVTGLSVRGRAEQLRAEQELSETKTFLHLIIENVPIAVVVKEPISRRFVLVNRAFEDFIGMSRDRLLGKTVFDLYESSQQAKLIDDLDSELLRANERRVVDDFELATPARGLRNITTTKLVIRDEKGSAKYLIAVIDDVTEKKSVEQRMAFMAHHDALTGLANRAALMEKLEEACARQRRWGEPFSALMLDLDRFKAVNDTLGHPVGDALLKEVAGRLKSSLRETDVLARLGGDEFAIIQTGETDQREAAMALANRILEIIARPFEIEGNELSIGTSIGIAMAPEHGTDPANLLKMADLALYRVKAEGRNDARCFEPEMGQATDARDLLESDLRQAIAQNQLELHYQPVVDVKTRQLCGLEALVRWRHPQKGLVFPDQFIPLAEETGFINQIGAWVLQTACADAETWPTPVKVAVNLSPVQFRKSNLVDIVICALAESGLPPERLELEITETALFEGATQCASMLRQFKNLGVTITLDDFGTGYSSLSQLTMFPFDRIKIDRSFTRDMTKRADSAAIISATLTIAYSLDIATTAEGVETAEQFRLLKLAGVSAVQGYLFKRPCRISEIDFDAIYGGREMEDAA